MSDPIANSWRAVRRERILNSIRNEMQRVDSELDLLSSVDRAILQGYVVSDPGSVPLDDLLQNACDGVVQAMSLVAAHVLFVQGESVVIRHSSTSELRGVELQMSPQIATAVGGEIVEWQDDGGKNSGGLRLPGQTGPRRSLLVRIDEEEAAFAFLYLTSESSSQFADDYPFVRALAQQLSIAIRSGDLVSLATTSDLYRSIDPWFFGDRRAAPGSLVSTVLARLSATLIQLLPDSADAKVQILFPERDGRLRIVYSSGSTQPELAVLTDRSVSGRSLREGKTLTIRDNVEVDDYVSTLGSEMRSECVSPASIGSEVIALLNVESPMVALFEGYFANVVARYARRVSFLLAFARIYDSLEEESTRQNAVDSFVALGISTANIIHRSKNDLGAIKARLYRMPDGSDPAALAAWQGQMLALADAAAENAARMRDTLREQRYDVNEMLREIIEGIAIPERIRVKLALGPDLPPVTALSLREALENVIVNSIDALHGNDEDPFVEIETRLLEPPAEALNTYIQIRVVDNGSGVDPKQMDRIFKIGETTKADRAELRGGMGLGLFLTRMVISRIGGEISLTMRDQSPGTEVKITMPVSDPES